MRRIRKRYVILPCLIILLALMAGFGMGYVNRRALFPGWIIQKKFTGNIFGKPNTKNVFKFPLNNPQFNAKVSAIKSKSLMQQSVTIYPLVGNTQAPVFQRNYYDDGFHGKVLSYYFASESATIRQSGYLGAIGCTTACSMVWSNFYVWDPQQKEFALDNSSHKDFFQQMLITYQAIDKRGCGVVSNNVVPGQTGISLKELYTKHPTLNWYCSPTQGIVPANLMFFLKAEKAVQEV